MGILTTTILWTVSGLMSSVATNRLLTASVTANAAILQMREEIQEVSQSSASINGLAMAVISHFSSLADIDSTTGANGIAVGPNGTSVARLRWDSAENGNRGLVYTFAVNELVEKAQITNDEAPLFLDRYELVTLGARGFNPFRLTDKGDALAKELQNPDSDADPVYEYEYDYGSAPTFVVDRPLDGAGTMVVNGNLHIRDTFAFHGVLVVLGDLVIEPTLKTNQFVWSDDGWPLDARGNRVIPADLTRDPTTGYGPEYDERFESWFYVTSGMRDVTDITAIDPEKKAYYVLGKKGTREKDENGNDKKVLPQRVNEYRGGLVLQGKLMVKGRIITKTVTDANGERHTGGLNAYWSKRAIQGISGMLPLGKPVVQRVSWLHNDSIDVESIWRDKQDTPAGK